jgi:hypothetical protein
MLPGLREGQEKMSKSDPSSAIYMEDGEVLHHIFANVQNFHKIYPIVVFFPQSSHFCNILLLCIG